MDAPSSPDIVKSLWKITKIVLDTLNFNEVTQKICDSLLSELGYLNLGYRIIVLSLYREDCQCLQRISLSQTPEANAATSVSTIPFHDILIPLTATDNGRIFCLLHWSRKTPAVINNPPVSKPA